MIKVNGWFLAIFEDKANRIFWQFGRRVMREREVMDCSVAWKAEERHHVT